jgi:hypothetical protein
MNTTDKFLLIVLGVTFLLMALVLLIVKVL